MRARSGSDVERDRARRSASSSRRASACCRDHRGRRRAGRRPRRGARARGCPAGVGRVVQDAPRPDEVEALARKQPVGLEHVALQRPHARRRSVLVRAPARLTLASIAVTSQPSRTKPSVQRPLPQPASSTRRPRNHSRSMAELLLADDALDLRAEARVVGKPVARRQRAPLVVEAAPREARANPREHPATLAAHRGRARRSHVPLSLPWAAHAKLRRALTPGPWPAPRRGSVGMTVAASDRDLGGTRSGLVDPRPAAAPRTSPYYVCDASSRDDRAARRRPGAACVLPGVGRVPARGGLEVSSADVDRRVPRRHRGDRRAARRPSTARARPAAHRRPAAARGLHLHEPPRLGRARCRPPLSQRRRGVGRAFPRRVALPRRRTAPRRRTSSPGATRACVRRSAARAAGGGRHARALLELPRGPDRALARRPRSVRVRPAHLAQRRDPPARASRRRRLAVVAHEPRRARLAAARGGPGDGLVRARACGPERSRRAHDRGVGLRAPRARRGRRGRNERRLRRLAAPAAGR